MLQTNRDVGTFPRLKRVYQAVAADDGQRILIDGLWPRGVRKDDPRVGIWLRDLAPSTELRRWFDHDPSRWTAFQQRYAAELDVADDALVALGQHLHRGPVTLVIAARDTRHSNGAALLQYLRLHPSLAR